MTSLDVYLHDDKAGVLERQEQARLRFSYSDTWPDKNGLRLSCSLPLRAEPFDDAECRPFFEGLLPEGDFLKAVARAFHVSAGNPFALLDAIGGECAGAVSLVPSGGEPPGSERPVEWLSEAELADLLSDLPQRPLLANADEGFRLSLAGTRDKLPVLCKEGSIGITRGFPPSTHIIKEPMPELSGMVANEAFCLALASEVGLNAAEATPKAARDRKFLLVRRYDRSQAGTDSATRIHQEDLCQALGLVPALKYQAEGGPGVASCVESLRETSAVPARDVPAFLDAILFNLLIGNFDAHAKNYSLLLEGPDTPRLAPLYDLMSTRVYPNSHRKFAMKIGGEYRPEWIRGRHLSRLAADFQVRPAAVRDRIWDLVDRTLQAQGDARARLPEPWQDDEILDSIGDLIAQNAKHLQTAAAELHAEIRARVAG